MKKYHLGKTTQKDWPAEADSGSVTAIYQAGCLVPHRRLHLPEGTQITLQLVLPEVGNAAEESGQPARAAPQVRSMEAVYQAGLIQPVELLDLPEGSEVRLHMTLHVSMLVLLSPGPSAVAAGPSERQEDHLWEAADPDAARAAGTPFRKPAWRGPAVSGQASWRNIKAALSLPLGRRGLAAVLTRLDGITLSLVMLVYLLVRLVGLTSFPIYFFSDEAIHTNKGLALIQNGLRDEQGVFLPPYFRNADKWNLSLSVYLQGASAFLFGRSVWVTRATSVGISLLAGISVALILRLVFRLRYWWVGPLVLSVIPVWFLHSRTAFEVVMMVSFYACFLCAYLLYRYFHPYYFLAAMVFGAAAFYSYSGGQGIMLLSGVLLLISDFRYHQRTLDANPRLTNIAVVALVLLAVPYLRFRALYPEAAAEHLRVMNSIWIRDVPLVEKLVNFKDLYLLGLSPYFWFGPNNGVDLSRHTYKDWGNIHLIFLPLFVIGLWFCLRRWRESANRLVLIAILAAPFTAALAQIHNYRVLAMVIPVSILVSLGIDGLVGWIRRQSLVEHHPALGVGLGLAGAACLIGINLLIVRTALVNGPTWYSDYGMYGQQYGASQLFPVIAEELKSDSSSEVIISPDWANNPNEFVPFFLPQRLRDRVTFVSPKDYLTWKREISAGSLFVLPAFDYDLVRASGKMVIDLPLRVIPYPDGRPGFYFVRMHYVNHIDEILAAEQEARSKLIEASVVWDGQVVKMKHSLLDLGDPSDLFDNDRHTLIRGYEANPFVLEFEFPEPRRIQAVDLDLWRVDVQMTVTIVPAGSGQQTVEQKVYRNLPEDPHIQLVLSDGPVLASALRIELLDVNAKVRAKFHIADIRLR